MTRIIVERAHTLGREVARAKAGRLAERLEREFGANCAWRGDVLEVRRSGADGQVEVSEDRVTVSLKLGLLLAAMAGPIQSQIESALDKALSA